MTHDHRFRSVDWLPLAMWAALTACGTLGFALARMGDDDEGLLGALAIDTAAEMALSFGALAAVALWLARNAGFTVLALDAPRGVMRWLVAPQFLLALALGLVIGFGNFAVEILTSDAVASADSGRGAASLWTRAARNVLYDSIAEEVLFRLLLMSLVVYVGLLLFPAAARGGDARLSALALAISSLACAANAMIDLPTAGQLPVAVGAIVLGTELAIGVVLGFIYWRIGFEAAVVAHVGGYVIVTLPLLAVRAALWP
ncbi:MAG: CPBP family glutamic-type intramembrane protease [Rhodospirillaceae bacterium]|nr:CPBP family glutamic-type intramembrane protease [Rhodospirillaceae bacterium]